MLLLKVEYDAKYYADLLKKLTKLKRKSPIHVDVFSRRGTIFVIGLDDGFSVAFIYVAYLKAKKRGLRTSLLYARYIEENWLPEEVRRLAESWLSGEFSVKDADKLKSYSVTEHVLMRWCS